MKSGYIIKILISFLVISAVSLCVLWFIFKPAFESSVVNKHVNTLKELQKHTTANIDNVIANWLGTTQLLANQISRHPKEGEIILNSMLSLHPEIVQIRVYSANTADELESHNTVYSNLNVLVSDSVWQASKVDSAVQFVWVTREEEPVLLFLTKRGFKIQNVPFNISIIWNAQKINEIFQQIPFDIEHSSFTMSQAKLLLSRGDSKIDLGSVYSSDTILTLRDGKSYRLFSNSFSSVGIKMIDAIPVNAEKMSLDHQFTFLSLVVIGSVFIMVVIAVFFFFLERRKIKEIKGEEVDVQQGGDTHVEEQSTKKTSDKFL